VSSSRKITAHGFSVTPPSGWEAAIYRRPPGPGERTYPILHAATRPLSSGRGDYGAGVVETLGPDDVFISLLDFGPWQKEATLFQPVAVVPRVTPESFRSRQLQRVIRRQAGVQRFVAIAGRALCLYTVIGSMANRLALARKANELISTLVVDPL